MMGDGIAIQPDIGRVVAPFEGVVETVFETKHAIGLKSYDGCEILIHIGLDTVELNGVGYTMHVSKGDIVAKGDLLVEFDIVTIQKEGYDTITPIIITNTNMYQSIDKTNNQLEKTGELLMRLKAKI